MRQSPNLVAFAAALALTALAGTSAPAQDVFGLPPDAEQGLDGAPPNSPGIALPDSAAPQDGEDAGSARAERKGVDTDPKDPQDRDAMLAELYVHLSKAHDAAQAAPIATTIEGLWSFTESPTIGVLMNRAYKALGDDRNELALKMLDAVVELAPAYAEGWSRRAYVHYRQNDFDRAVGDLRRALALEPNHFKALDGLARILSESGQKKSALKVYEQLLRIHPYMPGAKEAADELRVEVEGQGI
jgi:tetratricopeptide (TPR) repeat protein